MEDPTYYERRAQILIEEARAIRLSNLPLGEESYNDKMIQAIRLLVLALML
jgi:hypothetical protein